MNQDVRSVFVLNGVTLQSASRDQKHILQVWLKLIVQMFQPLMMPAFVPAGFAPRDELLPDVADATQTGETGHGIQSTGKLFDRNVAFRLCAGIDLHLQFITIVRTAGRGIGIVETESGMLCRVIE